MRGCVLTMALIAGCSSGGHEAVQVQADTRTAIPHEATRAGADAGAAIDGRGTNVHKTATCEDARRAIEARDFVGWTGLPAGCTSKVMFDIAEDDSWGTRLLGTTKASQHVVALSGYDAPLVSSRDHEVALFDGGNPDLAGGWAKLHADLGEPDARLDYDYGTLVIPGGEWVYAARGITVSLSSDAGIVYHVAVYVPTTVDDYKARLRPHLGRSHGR
jgi:hypothetical protein